MLYSTVIHAQDSTVRQPAVTYNNRLYNLYNYTCPTLNYVFNENMQPGELNRITVYGDYSANSKAVPAAFGYDLLFGYNVPEALIDRVDERLRHHLHYEDNVKAGATYEHYLQKWDGTFFASYNQRDMQNISASKQTYELLFYGNARFEGDTANLSNLMLQSFVYNQYTLGVKKTINTSKYQMQLGISLSFLQVVNNQDIATGGDTWLYTAPYGEYLDANYQLTFNSALNGAPKFTQLNGEGVSGDFDLSVWNKDKWKLSFDISDIGTMFFNNNPVNYSASNFVHFQGITLPNLASFSSQTFDTLNIDSAVRSELPKKTRNNYMLDVPFTINLIFSKPILHDRLVLNAGVQYYNVEGYHIYGYVKTNYFINPTTVISASAGVGGYSLFNLGFEFAKTWKYFDLAIGSGNLIGLALPTLYNGSGLYIRAGTTF